MTDDIKLPPLPRLQVPFIEADVSLADIKVLAQWCERTATAYARAAVEADRLRRGEPVAQQPADDEVVFIDGVGAVRSSVKSCRDGVQWIKVGDRVYWPLSDADAKRLHSACCGNGSFDGPATPYQEEEK